MAVKVIKPPKHITKEVECPRCGATLQYSAEDVHRTDWDENNYSYIKCPTVSCEHHVKVDPFYSTIY